MSETNCERCTTEIEDDEVECCDICGLWQKIWRMQAIAFMLWMFISGRRNETE